MAKQILNPGAAPNDGTGDSLRVGAVKLNENFNELYTLLGDGDNLLVTDVDFGNNSIYYNNTVSTFSDLNDINPTTYAGLIMLVLNEGSLYYANNGTWMKLLSDNSQNNVVNYNDTLSNVSYSGEYNDLRNRPDIPSNITDLGILDGSAGQVLSTDGTGNFTFRDVEATSVDFSVIFNKPNTLSGYGITDSFSGSFNDLSDVPVLFSGSYADLTNKPTIPSDVSQLSDNTNILFNGDYNNLTDRPTIPTDISQLTDTSGLLAAATFSGSYNDLTDKPTSFTQLTSIAMNVGNAIDEFSNDNTLAGNSNSAVPTEFAVKGYVDDAIANFSEIGNFSLTTDTGGASDVGVIETSDAGGIRIVGATEISGKLTLSAPAGIGLDVTSNVSISGNVTLWNNLINNLTLPSVTDTVAVVGDISAAVADYLPLAGGTVTGDLTVNGDLNTNNLNLTGTGTYTFTSNTNVELDAGNQIILKNSGNNKLVVGATNIDVTGLNIINAPQVSSTTFQTLTLNGGESSGVNGGKVLLAAGSADGQGGPGATYLLGAQGEDANLGTGGAVSIIGGSHLGARDGGDVDIRNGESSTGNIGKIYIGYRKGQFGTDGSGGEVYLGTAALRIPSSDGTAGQILTTDGSANLSFTNGFGNEAYDNFGLSTTYSPGVSVAHNNYLNAEAVAGDNGAGNNIEAAVTVTSGYSKIKVELDASVVNITDNTTEIIIALERSVNAANATDVKQFLFPAGQTWFGSQHFTYVDTHGASAGDTVSYKLRVDMSSYANESARIQYGICGDTLYIKEVA